MISKIFILEIIFSFFFKYTNQKTNSTSLSNNEIKFSLTEENENDKKNVTEILEFLIDSINNHSDFFINEQVKNETREKLKDKYKVEDPEINILFNISEIIYNNGDLDNVDNILHNKYDYNTTMDIMNRMLNECPELIDLLLDLTIEDPDLIYIVKDVINTKNKDIDLDEFTEKFKDNFTNFVNFTLHLIKYYKDTAKLIEYIADVMIEKEDLVVSVLEYVKNNSDIADIIIADAESEEYKKIREQFLKEENLEEILKIFIERKDLLMKFGKMLKTVEKTEHLLVKILQFLLDNDIFDDVFRKIVNYFMENKEESKVFISLLNIFLRELLDIYVMEHQEKLQNHISYECRQFLNYTLLGYLDGNDTNNYSNWKYDKDITSYYSYKFFVDTTKDKNELLTYENCLDTPPNFQGIQKSNLKTRYSDNFPTFIISLIDFSDRKNLILNSTFFENYYFVLGACFPQGKNESYGFYCKKSDYQYIMHECMKVFLDVEGIKITPIEINRKNDTVDLNFKSVFFLLILLIPLFIYIYLYFYRKLLFPKSKSVILINNLNNNKEHEIIDEEKEEKNVIHNVDEEKKKNNKKNIKIFPRWYKLLYEFFNFKENLRELFNFESQKTNINNTRGLNNIQGIMGISIILTILGQLYLIFFNLPLKTFGYYEFYSFISNFLYVFPLIGLRYSPRILFSCSGYTLVYKYLSFIEQGNSYYLLKFFCYQFYKYIILIVFILNLRYTLYFLISAIFGLQPMWKILYEEELKKPKSFSQFFFGLINLFFIDTEEGVFSRNLLNYFWIQFNEMNFFITGIIIISIGYKYKLRIDYLIIGLIIFIFSIKIIAYYIYNSKNDKLYTTLYYYLFDYGYLMLNPLFNINYFLIGMYFGLVNYSLQNDIKIFQQDKNNVKFIEIKKIINDSNNGFIEIDISNNISLKNHSKDSNEDNYNIINNKGDKENKINENDDNEYSLNSKEDDNTLDKNIYTKEIESMPFLKSTIHFIEWHRKKKLECFFNALIVILIIFISIFSISYLFFIWHYERKIDNKSTNNIDYEESDKLYEKLSLEHFITNDLLNFLYLIDIEFVVFFIQWGFFILLMKGQFFINNFFSHHYWSVFTKSYFSFIMVCNTIILVVFYESETVVKLNLLNLFLYFCINMTFILFFTIINYIYIDLPMKKIFRVLVYMFTKNDILNIEEEEEKEEEEEEEEEELIEENLINQNEESNEIEKEENQINNTE